MGEYKDLVFVILKGDVYYTGKPGVNEVEPVFSPYLARAKFYESKREAEYIQGAMRVLGRDVVVVPVTIELGSNG